MFLLIYHLYLYILIYLYINFDTVKKMERGTVSTGELNKTPRSDCQRMLQFFQCIGQIKVNIFNSTLNCLKLIIKTRKGGKKQRRNVVCGVVIVKFE